MPTVKQRLVMTLAAAGVPVDTVTITGPTSAAVTYMPDATPGQLAAGAAALAAFDWSDEAHRAWEAAQVGDEAKRIVLSADDAVTRATRAGCLALMLSLQECRAKVNELVNAVNAALGTSVEPLVTGSSFAEAMADVTALIDAGVV